MFGKNIQKIRKLKILHNNNNPPRWRRGRTSPPLRGPPRPFRGGIGFLQRML